MVVLKAKLVLPAWFTKFVTDHSKGPALMRFLSLILFLALIHKISEHIWK